jgi:hypothetical protein
MPRDFFPRTDAGVRSWANTFSQLISTDAERYSLTPAQAASFAAKTELYSAAYMLANANATNSSSAVQSKNDSRKALEAEARQLARIVRASPMVTNEMRQSLGLGVPKPAVRRIERPAEEPQILLRSVNGRIIDVMVMSQDISRRGKPKGVATIAWFTAVGEQAPDKSSDWTFNGNSSVTTRELFFDTNVPDFSKIWVTACWLNPRGEASPLANPIFTHIGPGALRFGDTLARAA